MNATASGQAFLAFAPPEVLAHVLAQPMQSFTSNTAATAQSLEAAIKRARKAGFAAVDQSYDDDVFGMAVPVFGGIAGVSIGALAVAAPRHRMTDALKALVMQEVKATAQELSRRMGY